MLGIFFSRQRELFQGFRDEIHRAGHMASWLDLIPHRAVSAPEWLIKNSWRRGDESGHSVYKNERFSYEELLLIIVVIPEKTTFFQSDSGFFDGEGFRDRAHAF